MWQNVYNLSSFISRVHCLWGLRVGGVYGIICALIFIPNIYIIIVRFAVKMKFSLWLMFLVQLITIVVVVVVASATAAATTTTDYYYSIKMP